VRAGLLIKHYLRDVAKVPFLVLQFDGHGTTPAT